MTWKILCPLLLSFCYLHTSTFFTPIALAWAQDNCGLNYLDIVTIYCIFYLLRVVSPGPRLAGWMLQFTTTKSSIDVHLFSIYSPRAPPSASTTMS